jgi:opacity protein-like surface antigen
MKTIVMGIVAALLAGNAAYAADLYQPPVEQPVEVVSEPLPSASGWYLRGDVGYAFTKLRGAHFYQGSNSHVADFDKADLDDTWTGGIGVGYKINNHLRADVTLDHIGKADFEGSTSGGCGVATFCTSRDISSLTAWSLMANAYVDIATYGAFTPYVGAGIGGTQVRWDKLKNTSCETGNSSNCDGTFEHDGKRKWRFTYGLMAGTAIDITCNLQADVGYRFRHILGGDMFGYKAHGGPGSDKGLYVHEARAGLRYNFGGCEQAAYVPEYPVEPPVYK